MGKLIKTTLIFMGGMITGGYCVVNAALKNQRGETFFTALKNSITEQSTKVLYGQDSDRPKRDISYYDAYWNGRIHKQIHHSVGNCDDIIFKTRKEAEYILDIMADVIRQYGVVSLADVYDIAGIGSPTYACNKYGWYSVDDGKVVRRREGYSITLPKPTEIK